MARALREGFPFPAPRGRDTEAVRAYLTDLTRLLSTYLREIGGAVNDDLLVRTDWIRAVDADVTMLPSDRILLVFATANRQVTIPTPAAMDEPHPLVIRHTGNLAPTVTINAAPSTLDGAATVALGQNESRVIVPLRQKVVDGAGVGTVGWYTISKTP